MNDVCKFESIERPAVAEDVGLSFAPVLKIDLRTVLHRDRARCFALGGVLRRDGAHCYLLSRLLLMLWSPLKFSSCLLSAGNVGDEESLGFYRKDEAYSAARFSSFYARERALE